MTTKTKTNPWAKDQARVEEYMTGVMDGTIPANEFHKMAVQRQLDDMEHGHERGLVFEEHAAFKHISFARLCQHFDSEWAGKPFEPELWELFICWVMYGWKRSDGTRRFRVAYVEVARGNGKSFLATVLSLDALLNDSEPGAQIYAGATKMDQAKIVHEPAIWMVEASPALKKRCDIRVNSISVPETHANFKPISSDAKKQDGFKPHFTTLDELHEHPDGKLYSVIRSGMGKRLQPLLFIITTAGFNKHSFCKVSIHNRVEKILQGVIEDDSWFGIIFTVDDETKWDDPIEWAKANPNLGVSITVADMKDMAKEAADDTTAMNNFLVKRLCVWTTQEKGWLNFQKWKRCPNPIITEDDLYGKPCYGGIDIGNTKDLAGIVWLFPWENKQMVVLTRCFIPREYAAEREKRDGVPYLQWANDGFIDLTDGETLDHEYFRDLFLEDCKKFDMQVAGYDPWNFHSDDQELVKEGVPRDKLIEVRQGPRTLSKGMKSIDILYRNQQLIHGNNPVLSWCATNVVAYQDRNENISPDKDKSIERIDLFTCLVIAETVRLEVPHKKPSKYETEGIFEA